MTILKDKILFLRNQGKSYRDIENELQCSKSVVAYHLTDKVKNNKRTRTYTKILINIVDSIKSKYKCLLCKEEESCCLDFHHVSDNKEDSVARLLTSHSLKKIIEEINKCIVLCSNCHRKVHKGIFTLNPEIVVLCNEDINEHRPNRKKGRKFNQT